MGFGHLLTAIIKSAMYGQQAIVDMPGRTARASWVWRFASNLKAPCFSLTSVINLSVLESLTSESARQGRHQGAKG